MIIMNVSVNDFREQFSCFFQSELISVQSIFVDLTVKVSKTGKRKGIK